MAIPGILFLVLAAPAVSATPSPSRVAVIALGPDAAAVGVMQQRMEARLFLLPQLSIRRAYEFAPALNPAEAPGIDAAARVRSAALLRAVSSAYFDDRIDDAVAKLSEAVDLQSASTVAIADRLDLLLWRATIALARSDRATAEKCAAEVLAVSPSFQVDLRAFPPALKGVVDGVRKKGLREVSFRVTGVPASSKIFVDDKPLENFSTRVGAGRHWIRVSAPGFRTLETRLEVPADLTFDLRLSLALESGAERALTALVWRGQTAEGDSAVLDVLCERLAVGGLVLVARRTDPAAAVRGFVWRKTGKTPASFESQALPDTTAGFDAIAEWAAKVVERETGGPIVAAPTPARTPPPVHARPSWAVRSQAGAAASTRIRSLSGEGGGFRAALGGGGPRAAAELQRGSWIAGGEAAWVAYLPVRVRLPDGSGGTAGGATLAASAVAGRRFGTRDRFWAAQAGLAWARHDASDARDASGDLGLFVSSTWLAPRVEVSTRSGAMRGLRVEAGFALMPWGVYDEHPAKTSGSSPRASSAAWRAAAGGRRFVAEYRGELQYVSFAGETRAAFDPPIRRAQVLETVHSLALLYGREF